MPRIKKREKILFYNNYQTKQNFKSLLQYKLQEMQGTIILQCGNMEEEQPYIYDTEMKCLNLYKWWNIERSVINVPNPEDIFFSYATQSAKINLIQ